MSSMIQATSGSAHNTGTPADPGTLDRCYSQFTASSSYATLTLNIW